MVGRVRDLFARGDPGDADLDQANQVTLAAATPGLP